MFKALYLPCPISEGIIPLPVFNTLPAQLVKCWALCGVCKRSSADLEWPGCSETTGMGFWPPVLLSSCPQPFAFSPHRQMIVWCLQMASCSTSSGYCSSWVRRSSWKRLIPCTYSIPGVESSSPQMRQEWKQQWRRLQPGLLSFVSTLTEIC